jgi:hypothetical protein
VELIAVFEHIRREFSTPHPSPLPQGERGIFHNLFKEAASEEFDHVRFMKLAKVVIPGLRSSF